MQQLLKNKAVSEKTAGLVSPLFSVFPLSSASFLRAVVVPCRLALACLFCIKRVTILSFSASCRGRGAGWFDVSLSAR
jgi:hypothetical protein